MNNEKETIAVLYASIKHVLLSVVAYDNEMTTFVNVYIDWNRLLF